MRNRLREAWEQEPLTHDPVSIRRPTHIDCHCPWHHSNPHRPGQDSSNARQRPHLLGPHALDRQRLPVAPAQLVDPVRWRNHESWTFFLFLFVLLSPVIAFPLSVLLLPESLEIGSDLKRRFYQNSHWFFALAALLPPIDALDTLLKGAAHFQAQGPIHVVTIALLIVLFITINLRVLA